MQLHSNGEHYFQLFHRYPRSGWAVHCALQRLYQDVLAACQPLGLLPFMLSHAPAFGCETPPWEEGRRSMVEFPCWQQWVTLPQRSPVVTDLHVGEPRALTLGRISEPHFDTWLGKSHGTGTECGFSLHDM